MKTVCIYHSIDLDGWMSAAIVKLWFKTTIEPKNKLLSSSHLFNTIDFIGYNYGQPIPDLSEYDKVIMCDISFPKEEMYKLWHNIDKRVIWIDHHISAINDNNNLVWNVKEHGLQDTKYSACVLTWTYFFPDETIPEIVRLLGLYDSFRHKGTDEETKVLEFQYGARQCISNYEEAYKELIDIIYCNNTELKIWNKGKIIYEYLCTEAKQVYKNGFDINFTIPPIPISERKQFDTHSSSQLVNISFKNYKFICINKERFNPINFGIDYHKDDYDGAACFHYANGMYNFSLYNDNGLVDCSVIAKQFGGGGHKGAAGFRLSKEQFNNLIK